DGMAKELAGENASGKAAIASPAPSPKPGRQRDEVDEDRPDNTAAIALSAITWLAQAIAPPDANTSAGTAAAASDSEQIVGVADETRRQASQTGAGITDQQAPSPPPAPITVATPGQTAA